MNANPAAAETEASIPATILIVEDDAGAAEIFEQVLVNNGYRVRSVADAESGLLALERGAASAIVLDLHLPVADGVEFLRLVRSRAPQNRIPVALVTGDYFLEEGVVEELRTLGARVHFKPLWEEDLLKLVHDLLHTHEA